MTRLNEDGIPTPAQHKRALGSKRQLWNSERTDNFWRATTIGKILRDERYTGKLVALKTTLSELGNYHRGRLRIGNPSPFVLRGFEITIDRISRYTLAPLGVQPLGRFGFLG